VNVEVAGDYKSHAGAGGIETEERASFQEKNGIF